MLNDLLAEVARHGRPAAAVDVEPIGRYAQRYDGGAQFPQDRWRYAVPGTMRAIYYKLQIIEPQSTREASFSRLDISTSSIIQSCGTTKGCGRRHARTHVARHQGLDFAFGLVA